MGKGKKMGKSSYEKGNCARLAYTGHDDNVSSVTKIDCDYSYDYNYLPMARDDRLHINYRCLITSPVL